ncbi:Transcription factor tau subunit sfc6 [Colletotrichum sidae]|uniref:Transcription factor tau subunit sfc6 n=1 Tax=Colletotrichum sidae TaxID=1347389 RepID=A0A4R8T8C3_9PEZI|nr:Transcription factor tau subunit sfc6 [Colletotrichum sidae]
MVRTRQRNKTRKIAIIDYGSDGEPPEPHDDSDDENFEAPPPDPEDDEDEPMDDVGDGGGDDDFEADDPSLLAIGGPSRGGDDEDDEQPAYTSSAGLRKQPVDVCALDKYHADGRPTRHYTGALKRGQRIQVLEFFYGPEQEAVNVASWLLSRWAEHGVLPSKVPEDAGPVPSPWIDEDFEEQQGQKAKAWFERLKGAGEAEKEMTEEEAEEYRLNPGGYLGTIIGPYPGQMECIIAPYEGFVLSHSGLPLDKDSEENVAGWMFDVGGIVIGMDWAPRREQKQVLALAVIPHSDQVLQPETTYDEKKGTMQLWVLEGREDEVGIPYPKNQQARLVRTVCVDWGRVRRLKWCPTPYREEGSLGLLAMLTGDGEVHVVSIKEVADDEQDGFTKLSTSIVSLGLDKETNITATCFAWVDMNRIVLGHSDGSLTLWSISPRVLIARQEVHSTYVIHIDTAYPSDPYLVASTPVAGYTTLVDFSDPEAERSSFPCFTISPQPNLLQWNDHLRGFFTAVPSANPLNASIGFIHSRWYAAQVRKVMDGDRLPTSLAVGHHHPFALVGYLDGTLWSANPANRIFASKHHFGHKMKLFEHQYIPRERIPEPEEGCRGLVRIVQGFRPVPNVPPKVDGRTKAVQGSKKKDKKGKKSKAKTKAKTKDDAEDDDADVQGGQDETENHFADPKRAVLSEALTRVTTMAWNPNEEYSCWAAVAMASGLVRVLDLGLGRMNA